MLDTSKIKLSQYELEVFNQLNNFRNDPSCFKEQIKKFQNGLEILKPQDPFTKEINIYLNQTKVFQKMEQLQLNKELCFYAYKLLNNFIKNKDSHPKAIIGKYCKGKIPDKYLVENPAIIYDEGGSDSSETVIPRLLLNKSDIVKDARRIITNPYYTQVGISRASINKETNMGVFIFVNNIPEEENYDGIDVKELEEYKKVFDLLDYLNEGRINVNDILDSMESNNLNDTDPTIYNLFKELKYENEQYITYPVFVRKMHSSFTNRASSKGLKNIFDLLVDNPKKNVITIQTIKDLAQSIGYEITDQELASMLIDGTTNSEITFKDFEEVMKQEK